MARQTSNSKRFLPGNGPKPMDTTMFNTPQAGTPTKDVILAYSINRKNAKLASSAKDNSEFDI